MLKNKLLPLAVLGVLAAGNAHAFSIDDFNTGLNNTGAVNSGTAPLTTGNLPASGAIGGNREVSVESVTGISSVSASANLGGAGVYIQSNDALTSGSSRVVWNGSGSGLGGVDLTDAGASDALLLSILAIDVGSTTLTFSVTDTFANVASLVLSNLGTGIKTFNFSSFTNAINTDFGSVDRIQLDVVSGQNADLVLDLVETNVHQNNDLPEPGSLSLLGLGLAGLAARRRKSA